MFWVKNIFILLFVVQLYVMFILQRLSRSVSQLGQIHIEKLYLTMAVSEDKNDTRNNKTTNSEETLSKDNDISADNRATENNVQYCMAVECK